MVDEHLRAKDLRADSADCAADKRDLADILHKKNEVIDAKNGQIAQRDSVGKKWEKLYNTEFKDHEDTKQRLKNVGILSKVLGGICLVLTAVVLIR